MSENKLDQVTGKVKEVFGKATGDKEMQAEGVVENALGKAKEAVENVKDTVKGVVSGLSSDDNEK